MKKISYNLIGYVLILLLVSASGSCKQASDPAKEAPVQKTSADNATPAKTPENMPETFKGKVVEKIDVGPYTYVQVDTGAKKIWAAAPTFDTAVGETVIVPPGLPMANFKSSTLNREFDLIYFVSAIHKEGENQASQTSQALPKDHPPIAGPLGKQMAHPAMGESSDTSEITVGPVEKAEGGQTVSEVITDAKSLAGKNVLVRAQVVKFTPNIMDKNWVHVRDGSGDTGSNDLILTTDATVKVGDVVLVQGVVSVDRDFGFGLSYKVIIENAKITVEKETKKI